MKSKTLLAACFLLFLGEIMAQNRPFRVGIFVSPGTAYRRSVASDATGDLVKSILDDAERPKISGSGGLFVEHDLNLRNSLRAGLEFMNLGYQSKFTFTDANGTPTGDGVLRSNFNYIAVPIDWRLVFYEKRCANFLSFGIAPAFFLSESTVVKTNEKRTVSHDKMTDFNKTSLVGQLGFGFSFPINNVLTMEFQPRARYFFTKLNSADVPLNFHLWDAGVQVAVKF